MLRSSKAPVIRETGSIRRPFNHGHECEIERERGREKSCAVEFVSVWVPIPNLCAGMCTSVRGSVQVHTCVRATYTLQEMFVLEGRVGGRMKIIHAHTCCITPSSSLISCPTLPSPTRTACRRPILRPCLSNTICSSHSRSHSHGEKSLPPRLRLRIGSKIRKPAPHQLVQGRAILLLVRRLGNPLTQFPFPTKIRQACQGEK